ncbi:MAG: hypothetical protein GF364_14535 [Candidatus Lokiarchaeota archaeon]|nr:hypothetical protein [Candidatus Lokiarchaeota archaeon]
MAKKVELIGLQLPEIVPEDDLPSILLDSIQKEVGKLKENDILVLTSKIVSKANNLLIKMDEIEISKKAIKISKKTGVDVKYVQMILDHSDELLIAIPLGDLVEEGTIDIGRLSDDSELAKVAMKKIPTPIFVRIGGQLYSNAGIDYSNHPKGIASYIPKNLDEYARKIREKITQITNIDIGIVISDTEMLPFGSLDLARGCSGVELMGKLFGEKDKYGNLKWGGAESYPNELAIASGMVMGQIDAGIPAVLIRGMVIGKSEAGINSIWFEKQQLNGIIKKTVKKTIKVLGLRNLFRIFRS